MADWIGIVGLGVLVVAIIWGITLWIGSVAADDRGEHDPEDWHKPGGEYIGHD